MKLNGKIFMKMDKNYIMLLNKNDIVILPANTIRQSIDTVIPAHSHKLIDYTIIHNKIKSLLTDSWI